MLNTSLNTLQEGNVAGKKFRESHKKNVPRFLSKKLQELNVTEIRKSKG